MHLILPNLSNDIYKFNLILNLISSGKRGFLNSSLTVEWGGGGWREWGEE